MFPQSLGFECKLDLPSDSEAVILKTLFEYRTAERRLDWIDLLAFGFSHLSLDGRSLYTAEVLRYIDGLMSLGVKAHVF